MTSRKEYEKKVKSRLEELERDIEHLKVKVRTAEADLTEQARVAKLHAMKEEAKEKLDELLNAEDDAWEDLQTGLESYWRSLGNELKAYENISD